MQKPDLFDLILILMAILVLVLCAVEFNQWFM